ncbi:hypothetical protein B0O80DRAFT_449807 [Mortierella sp. GBAus27b]|nr:hypothetical protein B0O80DRAFT_449807 [Mortierella sp. GBAus27b]
MPPGNPLGIPEVASIVASYLKGQDLARCVRVSTTWQALFLPHRWQVIKVGSRLITPHRTPSNITCFRFGPHPTDIYRHRHLIRDLSIHGDSAGLDKFHYPHLHKLTVNYSRDTEDKEREIFLEFTDMFPCLTEVVLISVKVDAASWSLISLHQHITKLSLYYMEIKAADSQAFWEACLKLESLSLDNVTIEDGWIPTNVSFAHMHTLTVFQVHQLDRNSQLQLILQCPELKVLLWSSTFQEEEPFVSMVDTITTNCWPHLNQLTLNCGLQSKELTSILEAVGNLVTLKLIRYRWMEQSSLALNRHFSTLVRLELERNRDFPSSSLRDVLCYCSQLEVLSGGDVLAWDIVNGGPWTCQRLRTLDICIRVGEWERDFQPEIFRRLSTLTRLEFLTMTIPEDNIDGLGVLEFQLVHGLGYLANLRKLKYVNFISDVDEDEEDEHGEGDNNGYCPQLGKDEIAWIQLNWKSVSIHGTLNSNTELNLKLRNLLNMFAF